MTKEKQIISVSHKEMAEALNNERKNQDDARHSQTESINIRFLQMEEKLDDNGEKQDIILTSIARMEESLRHIDKTVGKKADMLYVKGAIAVAIAFGIVVWNKIGVLETKVEKMPQQVVEQLQQNYIFTK